MNFHPNRSPLGSRKITIFPDNRLHSASPHQKTLIPELERQFFTGKEICHFAHADSLYLNKK
jgi:hypothetical protein